MKNSISKLESRIQYEFSQKKLLLQALTHSSYAHEESSEKYQDNEIFEFLGDSILGYIISDFLCQKYTKLSEGELSKLKAAVASTISFSQFALKIKLNRYILLGKGEESSGGRKKRTILAGTFEALVAAIYKDGGIEEARRFIQSHLEIFFEKVDVDKFFINNYKSALQEFIQKNKNCDIPVYKIIKKKGPDHQKKFTVEVSAENKILAKAQGNSIKDAEQKAAQKALKRLLGKKIKSLTSDTFLQKKPHPNKLDNL